MSGILGSAPVKFASTAEINTGTEAKKAIAPDSILAAHGFSRSYTSPLINMVGAGLATLNHAMGKRPEFIDLKIRNLNAEAGYVQGDYINFANDGDPSNIVNTGVSILLTSADIFLRFGSSSTQLHYIPHKTTGNRTAITWANWQLSLKAWF